MDKFKINKLMLGQIKENCYILECGENAVIIDPGQETEKIITFLKEKNLKPVVVLLTHGHYDHCYSVKALQELGAKCYVHPLDAEKLHNKDNMEELFDKPFPKTNADEMLQDGNQNFCGIDMLVLHTPGHTSGSCCFVVGDVLFSGDTLFDAGYGRTDMVDGDFEKLKASLKKLKPYFGLKRLAGH